MGRSDELGGSASPLAGHAMETRLKPTPAVFFSPAGQDIRLTDKEIDALSDMGEAERCRTCPPRKPVRTS